MDIGGWEEGEGEGEGEGVLGKEKVVSGILVVMDDSVLELGIDMVSSSVGMMGIILLEIIVLDGKENDKLGTTTAEVVTPPGG